IHLPKCSHVADEGALGGDQNQNSGDERSGDQPNHLAPTAKVVPTRLVVRGAIQNTNAIARFAHHIATTFATDTILSAATPNDPRLTACFAGRAQQRPPHSWSEKKPPCSAAKVSCGAAMPSEFPTDTRGRRCSRAYGFATCVPAEQTPTVPLPRS